jgi:circadian clock protein KaiC
MNEVEENAAVPDRVPTGIPGFDEILGGGMFAGGVYIVMGMPGAGKTILGNQLAFGHVRRGGRAVYVTLLSETHGRLLAFMQGMAFYEGKAVGVSLRYLNGYTAVESEGLPGLLKLVRQVVRESQASLLVIDGMMTAAAIAHSDIEYKKFVQELQSWIEMIGCTAVLLTSARAAELRPEYTMVDGIVELEYAAVGRRRLRELTVLKLRGSTYREGQHAYEIDSTGITLFPRVESVFGRRARTAIAEGTAGFGIPQLDRMLGGGLQRGSATLLLGEPGAGKSMLGLHFLAAGLEAGESAVHLGVGEEPVATLTHGDALGLRLGEHARSGRLETLWHPSSEPILDRIGQHLLATAERTGASRVFVDAVTSLVDEGVPGRWRSFWVAVAHELRTRGVALLASAAIPAAAACDLAPPLAALAAGSDNVVCLERVEAKGRFVRTIRILKARGRSHEAAWMTYEATHRGIRMGKRFGDNGVAGEGRGPTAKAPRRAGRKRRK